MEVWYGEGVWCGEEGVWCGGRYGVDGGVVWMR